MKKSKESSMIGELKKVFNRSFNDKHGENEVKKREGYVASKVKIFENTAAVPKENQQSTSTKSTATQTPRFRRKYDKKPSCAPKPKVEKRNNSPPQVNISINYVRQVSRSFENDCHCKKEAEYPTEETPKSVSVSVKTNVELERQRIKSCILEDIKEIKESSSRFFDKLFEDFNMEVKPINEMCDNDDDLDKILDGLDEEGVADEVRAFRLSESNNVSPYVEVLEANEANDITQIKVNRIEDEETDGSDFSRNDLYGKNLDLLEAYNIILCDVDETLLITEIELDQENEDGNEKLPNNDIYSQTCNEGRQSLFSCNTISSQPSFRSTTTDDNVFDDPPLEIGSSGETSLSLKIFLSQCDSFSSTSSSNNSNDNEEDLVLRRSSQSGGTKKETYYDNNQNPIIERVSQITTDQIEDGRNLRKENVLDIGIDACKKSKLGYIIDELVDTEKSYLSSLDYVIREYYKKMIHMKNAADVFSNIEMIYIESKNFYEALNMCSYDYDKIGRVFLEFKSTLFQRYPLYFRDKPSSDFYLNTPELRAQMKKIQQNLGDKLDLTSYLLKPIQRLGKYKLFLEQIQKELAKENKSSKPIDKALSSVKNAMRKGNDIVAFYSIQDLPHNLSQMGSFLYSDTFHILKPRKREHLFLFEKMLVFTIPDQINPEKYIYKRDVKIEQMGIVTFEEDPLLFHIRVFPTDGTNNVAVIEIEALSPKEKKMWTTAIEKLLWKQFNKHKEDETLRHRKISSDQNSTSVTTRTNLVRRTDSKGRSQFFIPLENR